MKKFKLMVLAFVIGTMNLFATNFPPDYPIIKDIKPPVKILLPNATILDSHILLHNKEIDLKNTSTYTYEEKLVTLDMQSENDDVLISILESLNEKRRISAIREYAYQIQDIARKE